MLKIFWMLINEKNFDFFFLWMKFFNQVVQVIKFWWVMRCKVKAKQMEHRFEWRANSAHSLASHAHEFHFSMLSLSIFLSFSFPFFFFCLPFVSVFYLLSFYIFPFLASLTRCVKHIISHLILSIRLQTYCTGNFACAVSLTLSLSLRYHCFPSLISQSVKSQWVGFQILIFKKLFYIINKY